METRLETLHRGNRHRYRSAREDATKAACRAVRDAVSRSCSLRPAGNRKNCKSWTTVRVEILWHLPNPSRWIWRQVMAEVPIGRKTARAVEGGLTAQGLCVAQFAPSATRF